MQVRAFVLHLVRATARRQNAHDLLDGCGLDGTIWPAVDGAAMSASELSATVGADLFDPPYPFPLRTGEIGCFLSHRQIWAEIQTGDADAALIIEDDAALDPEIFDDALELACAHIDRLGYIQLQTRPHKGAAHLVDTSGDCKLLVPELGGLRTTAQMVSRRAAAHLLAQSDSFDRPVDTFVQSHWHTGLRPAMIHPSGVSDAGACAGGSTIQGGAKSVLEKISREISRARYRGGVARMSRHSTAPADGGRHK